ncbi:RING-H2 finger protein ATL44 [Capsicum chinense]|nr:RING-H2 finger protein ATL44 [Capsicum chinense]
MSSDDPLHNAGGHLKPSSTPSPAGDSTTRRVDSDFVVVLAALLCALICVLGLVAVARCNWIRRISGSIAGNSAFSSAPANKGLKKKVLKSLPKFNYGAEHADKFSECAICLAEFAVGEEIRVLPQCGHGFHVGCIDTWLGSHSSCPSCRSILVVTRCHKCGELPVASSSSSSSSSSAAATGAETEIRFPRNYHVNAFLP